MKPAKNPQGQEKGDERVYRGGCWLYDAGHSRAAFRFYWGPDYRDDDLGFRIALVPKREKR